MIAGIPVGPWLVVDAISRLGKVPGEAGSRGQGSVTLSLLEELWLGKGLGLGLGWGREPEGPPLLTPCGPAAREAELRRLRKMNTEFEEQNAILQKHTESMNCAKEKLEQELAQEERQTLALQQQLQSVRQALTASFASLPIPGEFGVVTGTSGCRHLVATWNGPAEASVW